MIKVSQLQMPQVGEIQRGNVDIVPYLLEWKCELVCLQPCVSHVKYGNDTVVTRRLLHREQVTLLDRHN